MKILNFQDNYHKPSVIQGSQQYYYVTLCDEKCNFFSFLLHISIIRTLSIGIISLHRNSIYLTSENIANGINKKTPKILISDIRSNILSKSTVKTRHIQTILNQWIRRKVKQTKSNPLYKLCKFLQLQNSSSNHSIVLTGGRFSQCYTM